MMITKFFILTYLEKISPKNFKKKLRHQGVEAEREAEAIKKLPLLHPRF